ncbi:hypothetical protein [Brevundimonas sp. SGAir0440]|uniref:hypothetical protein n=1 Tax=Brevundimonas sp. SGAir0440 TaxID=2579977 RepID=UPI0010CCE0B3|nr:hypothetical protein [Brevundimonas sp. SGAir0440]QCQ97785.1 hypothetical protein E7T10_03415 [Brevundimonas sp. SGAir0440]
MRLVAIIRVAWLRYRIRRNTAAAASRMSKLGDVMELKAMIGTRWEYRAVDAAVRIVHETLEDQRFNGPWRPDHRRVALQVIRELFDATFPPGFVSDVFEMVEMMEPAR